MARLVGLVWHESNNNVWYELLIKFKEVFVKGGIKRMKYTLPSLVFAAIKLSHIMQMREINPV